MKRRYLCTALLALAALRPVASAAPGDFAIARRAGSPGSGGELRANPLPDINGRFGVTFLPLSLDTEIGDIDFGFGLRVLTMPLTLDWRPFHGNLHLSGGLIFNQTNMDLDSRSAAALTIGGHSYSASDLGIVHGDVSFKHLAPYAGIGWGDAFGPDRHWGILTDLGVAFLGRPHVALAATGPIASDPGFTTNLNQEERDIEHDLGIPRCYPVFSISLFYRFR
jgi:hypothetical protein